MPKSENRIAILPFSQHQCMAAKHTKYQTQLKSVFEMKYYLVLKLHEKLMKAIRM